MIVLGRVHYKFLADCLKLGAARGHVHVLENYHRELIHIDKCGVKII